MENSMGNAIVAILIAFGLNIVLSPLIIPFLHKLKFGQNIRDDGPESHLKKSGTPTMGGIIIILGFLITSAFFLKNNPDGAAVTLITIAFGIIGFLDDYIKVVKKRSLGLRAYQKIILQLIVTTIFVYYVFEVRKLGTEVVIPFTTQTFDLGIFYIPLLYITMIGTVNAVNLTDGLDGLAAGVTVIVGMFFLVMGWVYNSGVVLVSGAVVGSLLGFLLFNSYPAKVFMGDTGSLALGGFIAAAALLLKMPLFILIVGVIYLAEAFSVIIQVMYFKLTKGKRFFKMAPLHHHFELSGWTETKVVSVFYIITAVMCLVGFIAAKGI